MRMHIFEICMVLCMGVPCISLICAFSSLKKKIIIYLFLTFLVINIFQQFQKFCKELVQALRFLHSLRENWTPARRESSFKLKKSVFSAILTPSLNEFSTENPRNYIEIINISKLFPGGLLENVWRATPASTGSNGALEKNAGSYKEIKYDIGGRKDVHVPGVSGSKCSDKTKHQNLWVTKVEIWS